MQPSKLLFLVSSYLALFAAAAPLNGVDSQRTSDLTSTSEQQQGIETRQAIHQYLTRRDVDETDLDLSALSIADTDTYLNYLDESNTDEESEDLIKRGSTKKKSSKTAKGSKKTSAAKHKSGAKHTSGTKTTTGTKHGSGTKSTSTTKHSSTAKPKHSASATDGAACELKPKGKGHQRRADCGTELSPQGAKTDDYLAAEAAARKAGVTLQVGGVYSMIQKTTGKPLKNLHYRVIMFRVLQKRDSSKTLDVKAQKIDLVTAEGTSWVGSNIAGGEVESNPKNTWECARGGAGGNTYTFKGEVKAEYKDFAKVKKLGKDLLISGKKYSILTNNCWTFANEVINEITE